MRGIREAKGFWSQWTPADILVTKILILLEVAWTVYGVAILIHFRVNARIYLNDMILSVLAHVATPITLIVMLLHFEKNKQLPFLRIWWMMLSVCLEVILTATAWVDFPAPDDGIDRNLLFAYTLVSVFITTAALVLYMIAYFRGPHQSNANGNPEVMADAANDEPKQSQMSFNNGVANLRFPLPTNARIVHQPRKDI